MFARIDTTITSIAENPTEAEKTAAVQAIIPKIEGLTDAIHAAVKVSVSADFLDIDTDDVLETVEELVSEIVYTVKGVVVKLGLGKMTYSSSRSRSFTDLHCVTPSEHSYGCASAFVHRPRLSGPPS